MMSTDDDIALFWLAASMGCVGLLLGLRFKVASVVAVSGIVVVVDCVVGLMGHWSLSGAAIVIAISILAIQAGYVLGLIVLSRACGKS